MGAVAYIYSNWVWCPACASVNINAYNVLHAEDAQHFPLGCRCTECNRQIFNKIPGAHFIDYDHCICKHCGAYRLIVIDATLVANGERFHPDAPLTWDGFTFDLPDGLKDGSTTDEIVQCLCCGLRNKL